MSYAAYVVLVRALTAYAGGPLLPPWLATRIVFVALGITRVLAVGGAGGLGMLYWVYRQLNFTRGDAFARVIALNTLLYATFGAAALIAGTTILAQFGGDVPLAMALPWVIVMAALFLVGIHVTSPRRAKRLMAAEHEGRVRSVLGYAVAGGCSHGTSRSTAPRTGRRWQARRSTGSGTCSACGPRSRPSTCS